MTDRKITKRSGNDDKAGSRNPDGSAFSLPQTPNKCLRKSSSKIHAEKLVQKRERESIEGEERERERANRFHRTANKESLDNRAAISYPIICNVMCEKWYLACYAEVERKESSIG